MQGWYSTEKEEEEWFVIVVIMCSETMATAHDMDEFNSVLNQMKDDNKAKRRKALEKFNQLVFESDNETESDEMSEILSHSLPSLVPRMSDQSEINRINACNLMLKFIGANVFVEKYLIDIIPVLHHRLATVPQIEDSEDVKRLYINILDDFVRCFQASLIPYMNDIVNILKVTVLDGCPEVRKAACECVSSFAKATREKFHMQSESLVKPLLKGLTHQRFRNRIACINALGNITKSYSFFFITLLSLAYLNSLA